MGEGWVHCRVGVMSWFPMSCQTRLSNSWLMVRFVFFCCHYNSYCLFLWFIALLCSSDVKLRIYRLEWIPTLQRHILYSFLVFSGLRGSCSVCWYGWNCWSSLFIFSFHKDYNKKNADMKLQKLYILIDIKNLHHVRSNIEFNLII
jgi:hypothetical protein